MEPPDAPSAMSRALSLGGGGERKAAGEERSPMLVFVRLRPIPEKEKGTGSRSSVEIVNSTDVYLTSDTEPDHHRLKHIPGRHFHFDSAFPDTAAQEQVYAASTAHLVDGVLQGRNGTVFCYGATGTGKTYTMLGTLENPGLMMLAIKDLFSKMGQSGHHGNHSIQLSYLEVNNEVVKDLMSPGRRLLLRQDGQGTVAVGLTHCIAHSAEEVAMKLIQQGNRNRTEPTRVNERSHAILQVIVEHKSMYDGSIIIRVGKLSLFDLAGAESALVALKTCIDGPMGGRKKSRPCRSTKLTQLLKDSIEGSHNIVMIASISPSNISFAETQNTLHWADRAKLIKTKAYCAANEEDVKPVLELQDKDSGLQIEVPDSETNVAKLSLEMENIVLAAENVQLRWKVKVLEAEVEKMKDCHLMHLKKADVAEASMWKERVAMQHTCTHILALPDDAIAEILLHLPQDSPSCLLRASLVCKLWLRIVSDLGFLRRLRALHPTPHILGFFKHHCFNPEFVPTTASAFSLPGAMPRGRGLGLLVLDYHHGRVLFLDISPPMGLLVWEPMTGKQRHVLMPEAFQSEFYLPPSAAVVCAADECDHRGCHCHGGHFFLVLASAKNSEMFVDSGTAVWLYSSETGAWGEPCLVEPSTYSPSRSPNTLVGRTIYFVLGVDLVLKYDLVKHNLALLEIPGDLCGPCDFNIIIIPMEDGRMGCASVKDSVLYLWSCDDHECWALHRVIELDVPATDNIDIVGFGEGMDVIFLSINYVYLNTIELKSEGLRRFCKAFGQIRSPCWSEERKEEVPNAELVTGGFRSLGLSDEDLHKLLKEFQNLVGCDLDSDWGITIADLQKELHVPVHPLLCSVLMFCSHDNVIVQKVLRAFLLAV